MAARKSNDAGRLIILEAIIAGLTNSEIRKKLQDAGHPADLTDQTFTGYRKDKRVKEAIERKEAEAIQSGFAQRSERILKLARNAKRLERLLSDDPEAAAFSEKLSPYELVAVNKEYRETLGDIGALVDPKKPQPIQVDGQVKITGDALDAAKDELQEWRKQRTDELSSLPSAPPT